MTVFDKQIIPILLYGYPIWGSYNKVDIYITKNIYLKESKQISVKEL